MNDNQDPSSPHHAACLATLKNLREQLDAAHRAGIATTPGQEIFATEHFKFWRDQIDIILTQRNVPNHPVFLPPTQEGKTT